MSGESDLAVDKQSGMGDLHSGTPILSPEQTTLPAALNGQYYVKLSLLLRNMESGSIKAKEKHLPQLEWKACSIRLDSEWFPLCKQGMDVKRCIAIKCLRTRAVKGF